MIVSNYNYGHFLGSCLGSLDAQTQAPDEIVVVDDGSTDGSRRLLGAREGIRTILQDNAGQAAAFNAGFAASTGDAVLFLDADDVLNPEAIATIRALWTGGVAGLHWALDTVDASGAKVGRYPMMVPEGDLAPRMLAGLTMPFMPTSGNVFARDAIAWAFPLPEANWRISADAVLVRAALLAGPMRGIAQSLGGYRIHGANNYHRGGTDLQANTHRGLIHIAEAGLDLIRMVRRARREVPEGFEAKVLAAALRARLRAEDMSPDPAGLRTYLRRFSSVTSGTGPRASALAVAAGFVLPRSKVAREWVTAPGRRPRQVQRWLEALAGKATTDARYATVAKRPPFDGAPSEGADQGEKPLPEILTDPVWERNWADGSFDLRSEAGGFTLERAPGPGAVLRLWLAPCNAGGATVRIYGNGLLLTRRYLREETELALPLLPTDPGCWSADRIEIEVEEPRPRKRRVRWQQGLRSVTLRRMVLRTRRPAPANAVLPVLGEAALEDLGAVLKGAGGRVLEDEQLIGPGETLSLALPPLPVPFTLAVRFSESQGPGVLTMTSGRQTLFTGTTGPGHRIAVAIPHAMAHRERLEIGFGFQADEFLDGAEVSVAAVGWVPGRPPSINPGERIGTGAARPLRPLLGAGWDVGSDGAAIMTGPVAELHVALPASDEAEGVVTLDLEPLAPGAGHTPPLVMATLDGETRLSLRLAGRSTVEIPVPAGVATDIALHAAGIGEGEVANAEHGGIVLYGITLAGEHDGDAVPRPVAPSGEKPVLTRLLSELDLAASAGFAGSGAEALRGSLVSALEDLAPAAAWHLLGAEDLGRMAELADVCGPREVTIDIESGQDWLRSFALAVLSGPRHPALATLSLTSVPDLPADLARATAAVLMRDPGPGAPERALLSHQEVLVARLTEARGILADYPVKSARWELASAVLNMTRPNGLLFSDLDLKPHVAAFARALETRLLRRGHVLDLPDRARDSGERPRVGIVVRNRGPVPETWILKGLLAALPETRADVTVFLTMAEDGPAQDLGHARVVSLVGRSAADTVASIRAHALDMVILGAAFHGFMRDAEIAAHRLAPRQIMLAAAQYATTGLRSVDEMIFGALQAPDAARADCTEDVVIGPGTGQLFEFAEADAVVDGVRERIRGGLGIGPDKVVLTSGAMEDKISPEALHAWIRILAASPEAILVLYPFAANWYRDYDRAGFEARTRQACVEAGVSTSRVIVLPPLGNDGVRNMLTAADVYLVAFPYSGATTTLEALKAGLPTVARAERTQRGHQAAGWLEAFGLDAQVAGTTDDYVRIATDLVSHPGNRQAASDQIRSAEDEAVAQAPFRDWLGTHLLGPAPEPVSGYRYFFHHIPKTGGTSLRSILREWFEIRDDYFFWGGTPKPRVDLNTVTEDQDDLGSLLGAGFSAVWSVSRDAPVRSTGGWSPFCGTRLRGRSRSTSTRSKCGRPWRENSHPCLLMITSHESGDSILGVRGD